jgi:hypothetical protein
MWIYIKLVDITIHFLETCLNIIRLSGLKEERQTSGYFAYD